RQGSIGAVHRAGEIVDEDADFADLFELVEFLRVREFLLRGIVVWKIFARVRFARVDNEELKIFRLIFSIESGQRGNLPHKRRSGNAAELEQHVLPAGKRGQGNPVAVEIGQSEIRRLVADGCNGPKVRRVDLTGSVTLVVVTTHIVGSFAFRP